MPAISTAITANSSQPPGLSAASAYVTRTGLPGAAKMPEALDLLKTRRSVKPMELAGPGPSVAEIDTILTIASRVPDHGKLHPWRFILFEGDGRLAAGEKIAAVYATAHPETTEDQLAFERKRLARAPLVIAVVSRAGAHVKIPEWEQVLSAGAAAMSLVFAAHALGYAANWITEWYAYDRNVLDAIGVAPQERVAGYIHIGRPVRPPEDRPRPPLSDIVTRYGR
jgi:nitroreductase